MRLKISQILFLPFIALLNLALCQYSDRSDGPEVQKLLTEIRRETYRKLGVKYDANFLNRAKQQLRSISFNDGTEAYVNRPIADKFYENDIVLTAPQARKILREIRRSPPLRSLYTAKDFTSWRNLKARTARQIHPDTDLFWQSRYIPYRLNNSNWVWRQNVRAGIRHVEEETCFRFIENGRGRDYLFFRYAQGCWSHIGRVGGGQLVSIGAGCDYTGIVAHEIGHALGLWHEQARDDRDRYVSINWNNIVRGMEYNFYRKTSATSSNLNMNYDLGSLMHYSPTEFSRSYDRISLESNDPRYQRTIGQRFGFSFKDSKMINMRYCSNICTYKLPCQNGGYTDPNNCTKCRCPDGYGGTYCDRVGIGNIPNCGGYDLNAGSEWQSIKSPNLTANMRCYWRLQAPPREWLALYIQNVSFPCRNACWNFVEIKYGHDKTSSGARFCCDTSNKVFLSDNNEVLVILKTSSYLGDGYTGFELFYKRHNTKSRLDKKPKKHSKDVKKELKKP